MSSQEKPRGWRSAALSVLSVLAVMRCVVIALFKSLKHPRPCAERDWVVNWSRKRMTALGKGGEGRRDRRGWGALGICNGVAGSCKKGVGEGLGVVWARSGLACPASSQPCQRPETSRPGPLAAKSPHHKNPGWMCGPVMESHTQSQTRFSVLVSSGYGVCRAPWRAPCQLRLVNSRVPVLRIDSCRRRWSNGAAGCDGCSLTIPPLHASTAG